MSDLDLIDDDDLRAHGALSGLLFARVSNVDDPASLGRVKVWMPTLSDAVESTWARVLQPGAGPKSGMYWPLESGDEVIVAFVGGHPELPVVLGALWSKKHLVAVPEASRRDHRLLTSSSGHLLRFDDTAEAQKIELATAEGENAITLDVAAGKVTITAKTELEVKVGADITLSMKDGKITLSCKELAVSGCTDLKIDSEAIALKASDALTIDGSSPTNGVNINNGALVIT